MPQVKKISAVAMCVSIVAFEIKTINKSDRFHLAMVWKVYFNRKYTVKRAKFLLVTSY